MKSSTPLSLARTRHFQHLKVLWAGSVLLILSVWLHSVYMTEKLQQYQLPVTSDSLVLTPPGTALGHPEFQSPAVSLSFGPGIMEPQVGRLLISK